MWDYRKHRAEEVRNSFEQVFINQNWCEMLRINFLFAFLRTSWVKLSTRAEGGERNWGKKCGENSWSVLRLKGHNEREKHEIYEGISLLLPFNIKARLLEKNQQSFLSMVILREYILMRLKSLELSFQIISIQKYIYLQVLSIHFGL